MTIYSETLKASYRSLNIHLSTLYEIMTKHNHVVRGNQQKDAQELDIGKMHLDAIRKLGSG